MEDEDEVVIELSAPWMARPITEQDITWPALLKIAQENYKLYTGCVKRLCKTRAQKNEWKRKYELLLNSADCLSCGKRTTGFDESGPLCIDCASVRALKEGW